MIISIQNDNACWICGREFNKTTRSTSHHVLPKHMNPKNNVTVPICQRCHNRINSQDIPGMYSFCYKIERGAGEMVAQIKQLSTNVKKYIQNRRGN